MNMNRYFVALEPFQVLRATGSKPSNTWIGASQVIDTIYTTVTVQPGEELHWLVGGLFHVDTDGNPHEIRLTRPPHIFEAHYHRHDESNRLDQLLREEFIAPDEMPTKVQAYRPKTA